jgi:hypothetical protein
MSDALTMDWTEDDELLKYKLQELLKDNIVEITFTKVDGTSRTMKCTLKNTLIPESFDNYQERSTTKKVSEYVLPVWDIENNGWRSFRIHNVTDYIVVRSE